jgi:1-phosphofructokinase
VILTITPSPTLDLTYQLNDFKFNEVNISEGTLIESSGKGILVAMALAEMGIDCEALAPLSDSDLSLAWRDLVAKKLKVGISHAARDMRINTSLLHDGHTTKINQVAQPLNESEVVDFLKLIENRTEAVKPTWLVLSGHISVDNVDSIVMGVREISKKYGAKFAIDSSGLGLEVGIKTKPDFIKPNTEELSAIFPDVLSNPIKVVVDLAREISGVVILSNGDKPAIASDGNDSYEFKPSTMPIVNNVGAGDSAVAGFVAAAAQGKAFLDCVVTAMAWGQAACMTVESGGVRPEFIDIASIKYSKLPTT